MRSLARNHPIPVFLAITYLTGAAVFALPLLANTGIGLIDLDLPGIAPFVLLSAISLVAGAFVTTALADGRPGVRELRGRVFHFRVNPAWYVVALFGLPLVAVATAAIVTTSNPIAAVVDNPDVMLGTLVAGSIVAFLLVNWWEEVGWTGFALERLQPKLGPIGASVVTTWLQALLHLPLVFVVGGVTVGRVPTEQIPIYLVALFILPICGADPDHLDLQRHRPQRADRRAVPCRPRRGVQPGLHDGPVPGLRRRAGVRGLRGRRGGRAGHHPWTARLRRRIRPRATGATALSRCHHSLRIR